MIKKLMFAMLALCISIAVLAQDKKEESTPVTDKAKVGREELINKLFAEKDGDKAKLLAAEIIHKIDSDPSWAAEKKRRDMLRIHPLYAYLNAEDFDGFKRFLNELGEVTGTERIHFATAGYARRAISKGIDLDFAGQLLEKERNWALQKMEEAKKVSDSTASILAGREYGYALFTNDQAQLAYKLGEKKRALELSKEAMRYNVKRKDAGLIDFYVQLIAELSPEDKLKEELEQLVEDKMFTANAIERLKAIYLTDNKHEEGFDQYLASLNKSLVADKIEDLKKKIIDETAPAFSLRDLDGNIVRLADLKGKIVILDFWATWCGPCKASFPAMQTMVSKYKEDDGIRFLFIDTYEQGENKEKNARDYIQSKSFTFQVLMDNTDQVAKSYGAASIPAKFVIDRSGRLRFRSPGFSSDADLMAEIDAMIKLVDQ
ncbi:TlpA family protein disulfide reductase [Sphingobacterium tabacisoli]|uniref:TlpA family protein disulfide reductase n=1 Tax=Sphingobacterium tabacisoli TaxID=2044855 RepID=A0ABW5L8J3_9SPHI|nr:TlpA disulfide reductase family protein [Sphingobacterium tabacisoli]